MDVLTDMVDNDEGVVDVLKLLSNKSNTKTTPSNRKREHKKSQPKPTVGASRKLAFLPSNAKPLKISRVNKIAAGGEARNAEEHSAEANKDNKDKKIYCFDVTRSMKCKFKLNPKMSLKSEEIQGAAFIFSAELDPGEELLKIGDVIATKKDFESLYPTQNK
ncbi:uncharacterized protein DS421_10g299560 [Arachis hypogaea]|nr:uncharacterized protein DS421_10g299560 [Arachis hypogaea]